MMIYSSDFTAELLQYNKAGSICSLPLHVYFGEKKDFMLPFLLFLFTSAPLTSARSQAFGDWV